MNNKILNITNLSKSFGAFKVTDEITIDLKFNEIHALIGPNGAGKSTLIKAALLVLLNMIWVP